MKRAWMPIVVLLLAAASVARAEECMECHYEGKDKNAPIISVLGNSPNLTFLLARPRPRKKEHGATEKEESGKHEQ